MENMDRAYMAMALALAQKGAGRVSPNPMVGAVLVKKGKVVGRGAHLRAGEAHAEILALRDAGTHASGSTLYVTLEPCCHWGKTPPCTEALIKAGIKRVVAAVRDPNPRVCGKGFGLLGQAGISVKYGVLEKEAVRLNEIFFHYMRTGTPFGILKVAVSLDGKIATSTGESRWITGEAARLKAHALRAQVDALLVGIGTVLKDDPLLTPRHIHSSNRPWRVVVDSLARTPIHAKILKPAFGKKTFIAVTPRASKKNIARLSRAGAEILCIPAHQGGVHLKLLMKVLGRKGVTSVLFEGGGEVLASALQEKIVQKAVWFIAPMIIGGRKAPTAVEGQGIQQLSRALHLKDTQVERIHEDIMVTGYL